jgi:homoserine kinase
VAGGAYAGWLSGSGSSVLCVAPATDAASVAGAMRGAFAAKEVTCEVRVLSADNDGLKLE